MVADPLFVTCASAVGLGLRHALDSDHVAAITTMVTAGHGPRQAAAVGASWGLGHALSVVGAGAVLVALGVRVPPSVATALEGVVVVMLLVLGVRSMTTRTTLAEGGEGGDQRDATAPSNAELHRHPKHGPHEGHHDEGHVHTREGAPGVPRGAWLRAGAVGLVHGASGTAALALLALTTVSSRAEGVAFLLVFAAGATLSMTLLSFLLALPLRAATLRFRHGARVARLAAGALSFGAAAVLFASLVTG